VAALSGGAAALLDRRSTLNRIARLSPLALVALLSAAPALAQDPNIPPPAPPPPTESAVRTSFSTWSGAALGRADTSIRYGLRGDVEGPLVFGQKAVGDLGISLSVETLPAKAEGDEDLSKWGNVLSVDGWASRRIGDARFGNDRVSSSIGVFGAFSTAFFDASAEPQRQRFYRRYGVFVEAKLHRPDHDVYFRLGWCRDSAVAPAGFAGFGQVCVEGELPVVKGVRIYGYAGLGVGALSLEGKQTDYVVLNVGKPW
jgi:hypothetical protein